MCENNTQMLNGALEDHLLWSSLLLQMQTSGQTLRLMLSSYFSCLLPALWQPAVKL